MNHSDRPVGTNRWVPRPRGRGWQTTGILILVFCCALAGRAATFIWNGGGPNSNWSTAANWVGGVAPANNGTAAIVLAGTTRLTPNVDAAWSIASLTFSNNAGAFTLGGSPLTMSGGVTNSSATAQILNTAFTLSTNQTWSATSGILTFNGSITNGTNTLTIAGNFNSFLAGAISGTGGLTKLGLGTNYLSGTNLYSGSTSVGAGVLNIANSSALGAGGSGGGTTVSNGAQLQLQGGITVTNEALTLNGAGISATGALLNVTNNNTWNGPITLAAASTISSLTNTLTLGTGGITNSTFLLTVTGVGNTTVNGVIGNGTGGLTKTGVGVLTLAGSNSYSGATTLSTGVINLQNGSGLGTSGSGGGTTVAAGAQLQLQGGITVTGETLTLGGTGLTNSGALRNISGSNTWTGGITLAVASAIIAADSGTLDIEGNITNAGFQTTFTNQGSINFNGALSGVGTMVMSGPGTLSLGGSNTYTGTTTINGGTVKFTAAGSASSGSALTVNASGTLNLNNFNQTIASLAGAGAVTLGSATLTGGAAANTTYSGVMSGTGGYTKIGTGTLTLSGVNTFTGGTTINAGFLDISATTGAGNATNQITLNGGTLNTTATITSAHPIYLGTNGGVLNPSATLTQTGVISGPGYLIKAGTTTLILSATNTYLGGTTNLAGTVSIGLDAALGASSGGVAFSNSATLITTASFTSTRPVYLSAGTATFNTGTGFTNTFNGAITGGAGALTKIGSGVMVVGGANTYTNITTISAGTLRLGATNGVPPLSPVVITATTAVFDVNSFNATIGSLGSTAVGSVTLGTGSLTAGGDNLSTTNSSVISGNGSFTKAGTGTMILTGANTYTNTTTVAAGTLELGASQRLAATSPLAVSNGATFNMAWNGTNYSQTTASLSGAGTVALGAALTVNTPGTATFSGSITGTGSLTMGGKGVQVLSGTNTYAGATTNSSGTLQVNGVTSSTTITNASGATLSGTGTVGAVNAASGSTNAPGAGGPGTLTTGAQTWRGGANYLWDINDPNGTAGGTDGWSLLSISGALTITATPASPFNFDIVSLTPANAAGVLSNFDNTVTYIWPVVTASGGITGFSSTAFNINTVRFQNSLGAGSFTLEQAGNSINLIFTTAAPAAYKDVQTGVLTSSGNGTNTVTLPNAVNPSSSFLIFNTANNSPVPGGSMIAGTLTSSNTVQFIRATTETTTMNIQWYVIEYSAGVSVQRGQVNQTNTTMDVPLSPLAGLDQAFVTWSKTPNPSETSFTDADPVVGQITSTTNLQFRVGSAPSSAPVIYWQVVEFLNPGSIGVQTGSVTNLTGTNLVATAALPQAVNTNTTFLLTGYRTSGSGTSIGARMLRAQLTNSSTILFDRSISGAPDNISEIYWQAVQLNDGSSVQAGSANFPTGVTSTNVTFATIHTNAAVAFSSVQPAGGQNTGRSPSSGTTLGVGSATLAFTSATQMTLLRDNSLSQSDVGWFVVAFGPGTSVTPATGGESISADTTTNSYTSLTGPTYSELATGDVGTGTIILHAPAGFAFATNAPAPSVVVNRLSGTGANSLNINGVASGTTVAMTSMNPSNLTFTVTSASSNGVQCQLVWQNLRVQPTSGTPLANGVIVDIGTATLLGVSSNLTSFGYLAEVIGSPSQLVLATPPSSSVTAGVLFPQLPVVQIEDKWGNLCTALETNLVTATSSGTDTNQVNGSVTVVNGVASFAGMSYQIAQTNTITFSSPGLSSIVSGNIVVGPASPFQVTVVTDPSSTAVAGAAFAVQPVAQIQDQFGNLCTTVSPTVITATIDLGSDILYGTTNITTVNGVATFLDLNYQTAETITIDFTASGLAMDTSTPTVVGAAAASQLVIQTEPSAAATAGVAFAVQPVVALQDQYGNLCVTSNSAVISASRTAGVGGGMLQGGLTATTTAGVATFLNLSHNVATNITIDFNSSGLPAATSTAIAVSPAAASALAFLVQPGSAVVGAPFGVQPVVVTEDAYGNYSASGLTATQQVNMALSSGSGTLLGTTNFNIGDIGGDGAVTFTNLEIDISGSKQLTASSSGFASAVSAAFTVAPGSQTITFGALSNQTYGVAPFTVSASASSGLPVTFSISSGPATVLGSTVTVTGAGTVTVLASQSGNTNYNAATPVSQSFTVAALPVVLSGSKIYDGTTLAPAAALTVANNLDGANLTLSGSALLAAKDVGSEAVTATNLTPSLVQSATGAVGAGAATSFSVTLGSAPQDGNTLVAVISTRSTTANAVSSIAQTGATWSRAASSTGTSGTTTEIWYAPAVSSAVAGVTITTTTSLFSAAVVMEYSGVLSASPLDVSATSSGKSTSAVTGTTAATAQANELWIGGIGLTNSTLTLGSLLNSFTQVANTVSGAATTLSNANVYALAKVVSATGTAGSGGTVSASALWSGAVSTFKAELPTGTTLTLGGTAAGNYTLVGSSGSVTVTAKALTVSGITAGSTVYDGTTTAKLGGAAVFQTAEAAGAGTTADGKPYTVDSVSPLGTAAGVLASRNAGTEAVTISGITVTGTGSGNYTVTQQAGLTQVVTTKALTASGTLVFPAGKVYDGTTTATPTSGAAALATAEAAGAGTTSDGKPYTVDSVSLTGTAAYNYNSATVALATTITESGLSLAGTGNGNYALTAPTFSATITADNTIVTVTSSLNPAVPGTNVTFTAAVAGVFATVGTPTGTVQFLVDGVNLGSTASLSVGSATITTNNLTHGSHTITAHYAGDGNFNGNTGAMASSQVINTPPAAAVMSVYRVAGLRLLIAMSDVSTNWSDADGDTVTLSGINLTTTNGLTLLTNSLFILYTNSANVADRFSYGITDTYGGTNIGYVNITITASVTGTNSIVNIQPGVPTLVSAFGIPAYTYIAERSTNLVSWVDISTNSATVNGVISISDSFTDLGGIQPATVYYRLKWQP